MKNKTIGAVFILVCLWIHMSSRAVYAQQAEPANCTGKITVSALYAWSGAYDPLYKGYCNAYGYWVPGMITSKFAEESAPVSFVTRAISANTHNLTNTGEDAQGYDGQMSVFSCSDVGKSAYVVSPINGVVLHLLVGDCVAPENCSTHVMTGRSGVELTPEAIKALGGDPRVGIEGLIVYIADTLPSNSDQAVSLQEWWIDTSRYIDPRGGVTDYAGIWERNPQPK